MQFSIIIEDKQHWQEVKERIIQKISFYEENIGQFAFPKEQKEHYEENKRRLENIKSKIADIEKKKP